MVYTDYDDDEGFDEQEVGPVSIGQVGGGSQKKAHTSTMLLRRKCFGIPFVYLVGILLLALMGIVFVASSSKSNSKKTGESAATQKSHQANATPEPTAAPKPKKTPRPTPHPTRPTEPTVSPTQYPTRLELDEETTWVQLGNDVGGITSAPGNFGISVGVSGDGKTFAEGAHMAIGKEAATGHVRVFQYNERKFVWEQRGSELTGEKPGDEFGFAIDLSRDGRQVAVGAPGAPRHIGPRFGYFAVYQWNETLGDWWRMGPDKWGIEENDEAGFDLCISEDDGLLVVGAPGNSKKGKESGEVRVFQYMHKTDRWIRRGQDLSGEGAGDKFGFSVAVSDNGMIVAAGAPYNDDAGFNAGHVRVFAYNHTNNQRYHKLSRTIVGRGPDDNFGYSVSLSKDGLIVAAGAPSATSPTGQPLVGYVEIHKYDEAENKWHKIGKPVFGKYAYEGFGKSVVLSEDGHTMVVGAPDKKDSRGAIRTFKYLPEKDEWVQIGQEIEGDGDYDFWGDEVTASADGRIIVSGGNNFDGLEQGAGHVRVYRGV